MEIDSPATSRLNLRSKPKRGNSLVSLAVLALLCNQAANAQTVVPTDANSPCDIKNWSLVADWFTPGNQSIPLNGFVNPADSLHFPAHPFLPNAILKCDFYAWSWQMFLWLTSPAPPSYGTGSHVFNSPIFYDVSPPDATTGRRDLIRISPGVHRSFRVSVPQGGPHGKPVVFDNTGKMFTVIRPHVGPGGKPLIRNKAGQLVEIERTQIARNSKPVFLNKAGNAIDFQVARNGAPLLLDGSGKAIDLQGSTVVIDGKAFLQGGGNTVVDFEQGEADGNVLMAQNGSLVYYVLEVNDVYQAFLNEQRSGLITAACIAPVQPGACFPSTQQGLTDIQNKAGITFPDANVLTVELKSAWIETAKLADASKYVTITATIPDYTPPLAPPFTPPGATKAVQSGTRQATLALVGMHIVGTVKGHAEMIWATFEHVNNAPNAPYTYNTTLSPTAPGPPAGSGPWNFSSSGASSGDINSRMFWDAPTNSILSPADQTIGPVDIYRKNAWGTDPQDLDFSTNNADIIAINKSTFALQVAGDVRTNYILTGTTWIENGGDTNDPLNRSGTKMMANTTMETFQQPSTCFDCHDGTVSMIGVTVPQPPKPPVGEGLSHIFGPLRLIAK